MLFAPGGTLAIGMALKLARLATGRHKTLSLWDSVPRRVARRDLDRRRSGVPQGHGAAAARHRARAALRSARLPLRLRRHAATRAAPSTSTTCSARRRTSARSIIETVRCTDVQIPPPEYYRIVRDACDRHGALLILDEVPICLGRTGRMFAFEHYGIVPDMVVLGKGLGGAVFPMAALIARRDLDVAADRALGHYTHEKSSVGCAAALATLEVIEDEQLLERSRDAGRARARPDARRSKRAIRSSPTSAASACCSASSSRATACRRGARPSR